MSARPRGAERPAGHRIPVNYDRAAEAVLRRMPTDPDVIERQQVEAAVYVEALYKRIVEEEARHRYFIQHFILLAP